MPKSTNNFKGRANATSTARLVLCTCQECRVNADKGRAGRMVTPRRRRAHQQHEALTSTVPALRKRGKRVVNEPHPSSRRGRGGLPVFCRPQPGPSGLGDPDMNEELQEPSERDNFRWLDAALENMYSQLPEHPNGPSMKQAMPTSSQATSSDTSALGVHDTDMEPAINGIMSDLERKSPMFDDAREFRQSPIPLFDSELDEAGPDITEDLQFILGAGHPNGPPSDPDSSSRYSSDASEDGSTRTEDSDGYSSPYAGSNDGYAAAERGHWRDLRDDIMPGKQINTLESYANTHEEWYIRIFMLVVTFLHTKHHLSFRAAGVLLWVVKIIFVSLGLLAKTDPMPTTLSTTFSRLGFSDRFRILLMCPQCRWVNGCPTNPQEESESTCEECNADLYNGIPKNYFDVASNSRSPLKDPPTPKLVAPYTPLSVSLADFLARPGMEEEMESWRSAPHTDGSYKAIWDGAMWKKILGPDGQPFFDPPDDPTELRIGLTGHLDWFKARRGDYSPNHSSGVLSFGVANLPIELKKEYRPEHLLVTASTPGPTEPTAEELQYLLGLTVDELLVLYKEGIVVKTPRFPQGRRIRIVLLAIVCDHPAAVKMCGFADKNHNEAPCTRCEVDQEGIFSQSSLEDAYNPRDGEEIRRLAYEWAQLKRASERDNFFKEHGVRWFEFARLPYFDAPRMTIIDPMHNLLMGVMKNHWFGTWIKLNILRANTPNKTRELDLIHNHLRTFEMPPYVARPARYVGESAGGGMSADMYKGLGAIFLPAIIPLVWDASLAAATSEYQRACASYAKRTREWEKKWGAQYRKSTANIENQDTAEEEQNTQAASWGKAALGLVLGSQSQKNKKKNQIPSPPKQPQMGMQPGEDELFLKLGTALKIITQYEISSDEIDRAGHLLNEYLIGYLDMYGAEMLKPNHHFAVHLCAQMRDYGPVYGTWCFLGERLNKLLKSFKSNNWGGGQLEVSMFREWGRDIQMREMLRLVADAEDDHESQIARYLIKEPVEARGTVEAVTAAHEEALADVRSPSPLIRGPIIANSTVIPIRCQAAIAKYYNNQPNVSEMSRVYLPLDLSAPRGAKYLARHAVHHIYIIKNGRRIVASLRKPGKEPKSLQSSLVQVRLGDEDWRYGEVTSIFEHTQSGHPPTIFAEMAWFKTLDSVPTHADTWNEFPELDVQFHALGEFEMNDPSVAAVPLASVQCHLARASIFEVRPPQWITVTLEKMSTVV